MKRKVIALETLGEGSFGKVVKVKVDDAWTMACKMHKVPDDNGLSQDFVREVAALRDCQHPNVLKLIDVVQFDSQMCILTRCMECSLSMYMKTHFPILKSTKRKFRTDIINGILHLHGRGYMHRDLKPSNLLVGKNRICIGDFGTARMFHDGRCYTVNPSTIVYAAPELCAGWTAYTPIVDIWAFGCIYAEMCYGEPLFQNYTDHSSHSQLITIFSVLGRPSDETLRFLGEGKLIDIPAFEPTIKATLSDEDDHILDACLQVHPWKRISSAGLHALSGGKRVFANRRTVCSVKELKRPMYDRMDRVHDIFEMLRIKWNLESQTVTVAQRLFSHFWLYAESTSPVGYIAICAVFVACKQEEYAPIEISHLQADIPHAILRSLEKEMIKTISKHLIQ